VTTSTAIASEDVHNPAREPVAWLPVGLAVVAVGGLLAATSNRYDYHRDELYFRMLEPAWGYVDQPPLTPLIAKAAIAVLGDTLWAIRVPATLAIAVAIVLAALTTRELGGGRTAQALSAWSFGFATLPLVTGHLFVTATVDFALWAAVLLCVTRALLRPDPRWWLAAGAVVGLCTYNKLLIALLVISVLAGLLIVGPRGALASRWFWAGAGIALVLALPNLIYQATHDFPQLTMAGALSENNADEVRVQVLPFQLLQIGPTLVPVWVAGVVALLRRPQWRPIRALGVAYFVAVVLTIVGGGQIYYAFGLQAFLLAAGWVPTVRWIGDRLTRRALVVAAIALNAVTSVLMALPVLPATTLAGTPITEVNPTLGDQIGWPVYVKTVADVYHALPADEQARAVIYTGNYGEAGAVVRYGGEYGLPPVYSGQNQLYFAGPPPADRTVVIAWTQGLRGLSRILEGCEQKATLDNGVGVDNEEQASVIAVCHVPAAGWAAVWPQLQHYD
jgi:hypothetical protein